MRSLEFMWRTVNVRRKIRDGLGNGSGLRFFMEF